MQGADQDHGDDEGEPAEVQDLGVDAIWPSCPTFYISDNDNVILFQIISYF